MPTSVHTKLNKCGVKQRKGVPEEDCRRLLRSPRPSARSAPHGAPAPGTGPCFRGKGRESKKRKHGPMKVEERDLQRLQRTLEDVRAGLEAACQSWTILKRTKRFRKDA